MTGLLDNLDEVPRGLPRPIVDGLPVPYSSEAASHANVHSERAMHCVGDRMCGVCGKHVDPAAPDERGRYWAVATRDWPTTGYDKLLENFVMHRRCVRLTMVHCPRMRMNGHGDGITDGVIDNYPVWLRPDEILPGGRLRKPLTERQVRARAKVADPGHAARQYPL